MHITNHFSDQGRENLHPAVAIGAAPFIDNVTNMPPMAELCYTNENVC